MKHNRSTTIFTLLIIISICLALPLSIVSNLGFAESDEISYDVWASPYFSGRLIIGFKKKTPINTKLALLKHFQLESLSKLGFIDAELVKVKINQAKEVLDALRKNPNVAFVEYDYLARINYEPNDPLYPSQIYLQNMNTDAAWDITMGNPNITIAILDTGISSGNIDLDGNVVGGYNFIDNNTNFSDDNGHGTMVASVAAGISDNSYGLSGISGKCMLLAVKVMNSSGLGTYSSLIKGIEYAVANGANVINMSVGGQTASTALKQALDYAIGSGVTVVAAAGNEGSTNLNYPAAYKNVIGVGAVDYYNNKKSYSNTGNGLTIMAGGTAKVATSTTYFESASGTSFSSAYIAGLVALMYSINTDTKPEMVINALSKSALDLGSPGYDTTFGYGLVDMGKSLSLLSKATPQPIADSIPPVLTLNGDSFTQIDYGNIYEELGAKANDNLDGDISTSVQITGTVNTDESGVYNITYSVSDYAGNFAIPITRTIEVLEEPLLKPIEQEIIELENDLQMIRDVEIVKGTLNKSCSTVNHVIEVISPGQLDLEVSYVGQSAPEISISNLDFNGRADSFDVTAGNYIMTLSSYSKVNFTVTITHPERSFPINIPLGVPEIIVYGQSDVSLLWYIYLGFTLVFIIITGYLFKTKRICYNKKQLTKYK